MKDLIKIVFHCETITPLISSGSDQSKFELRSASVKGLLRFWWRTFQNPDSTTELYKRESEIFGSSDQSVGASKARVIVEYDQSDRTKAKKPRAYLQNNQNLRDLSYFLYAYNFGNNRDRECLIPPPFRFRINLLMPNELTPEVFKALWLLYVFGGIGARTRRGFGAFRIKEIKAFTFPQIKPLSQDQIESLELFDTNAPDADSFIKTGLSKILPNEVKSEKHPPFTTFVTKRKSILILQCKESNPTECLSRVAKAIRDFRHKNPSAEVKALHDMITGINPSIKFTKPASGLPIIYNFRTDQNHQIEVSGKAKDTEYHRRSSPLLISLFEYKGNSCVTVLHLPSEFLPSGSKLLFKVKERNTSRITKTYVADFAQNLFVDSLINHLGREFSQCNTK